MKNTFIMLIILILILPIQAQDITNKLGGTTANETYDVTDSADKILFRVQGDGNIGVGTDTPFEVLDIDGNIAISGTVDGIDIATDVGANTAKVTDDDDGVAEVYGIGWDDDIQAPTKNDVYDKIESLSTGTDNQTIDIFSISGNDVQLSVENDGEATKTVDISTTTAVTANTAKLTNATHTGDVTGSTVLTIGDDKILEKHLKAVDTPNDEEYLTYESTTGDFEWQALPTGSGNTLDQAYDQGGAGLGRTIIADNGSFEVGGVDGALFSGTYNSGTLPASGAGTRMMWYPKKAAFRAGYLDGTQWDDGNIGVYSVAMGLNSTASGWGSTAMGGSNIANAQYSTSMGYVSTASGNFSTAMGNGTTASGTASTSMGYVSTASGNSSTAMGNETTASGFASTAMGREIQASGDYSVAIALNDQNGTNVTQANTMAIMGGKVGIGIATPDEILHINGNLRLTGKFEDKDGDAGTAGQILSSTATGTDWITAPSASSSTYGEIFVSNSTTDLTVAASNTWYQVTTFTNAGNSSGITVNAASDDMTIQEAGVYMVVASIAFSGGANAEVDFMVKKNNGTADFTNLMLRRKLGSTGDVGSASISGIASFLAIDTVELWFKNLSNTNAIRVVDANLSLVKL